MSNGINKKTELLKFRTKDKTGSEIEVGPIKIQGSPEEVDRFEYLLKVDLDADIMKEHDEVGTYVLGLFDGWLAEKSIAREKLHWDDMYVPADENRLFGRVEIINTTLADKLKTADGDAIVANYRKEYVENTPVTVLDMKAEGEDVIIFVAVDMEHILKKRKPKKFYGCWSVVILASAPGPGGYDLSKPIEDMSDDDLIAYGMIEEDARLEYVLGYENPDGSINWPAMHHVELSGDRMELIGEPEPIGEK